MLEQYFQNILKKFTGDTTEPSFYSTLENFIQEIAKLKKIGNITITQQPKRLTAGTPDFTIRRDKELIGYIEAKDIGVHLEDIENDKQIEKYKKEFDNFILTNYFDFWLWRKNEKSWILKTNTSKGELINLKASQSPPVENEKEFLNLVETFFRFAVPERKSAKSLAIELAIKTKLIPSFIVEELNNNVETEINRVYKAFQEYLIPNLSKEDFADIYAQTITYGLFMARLRHEGKDFNRFLAQQYIPQNIQILRDTFSLISGYNLPKSIDWIVDDIATILAYADIEKIRKELHYLTGEDDPVIYFYETFLKEYNPKEKKHRGVYYTPLPVVSYITRSINILLKEKFSKNLGFASEDVTLLDPASGTLTFPANAIRITKEEIDKSSNAGSWLQIVKNHILKDYYAFELLMAPYIIGHLKISLLLEDLGYKLEDSDKIKLYLTNTLDLSEPRIQELPTPGLVYSLTEEAKKAKEVKEKIPVLVVMGNPPYSVSSSNIIKEGSDFHKLYESYKEKVRTEERNIQPLSDDYIKFIAFAHWKIKQVGQGIIGMITNNSYLDGLIHRDMRRKLAEDFDEIYILNLHGSSKRNEKTPEGGKDENVFDIQQGVGIILLVKKEGLEKKISYFDLYGLRKEKYKFLEEYDIKNTKWQELKLKESHNFFVPKDFSENEKYENFISLEKIFNKTSSGIKTHRDHFIIGFNDDEIKSRLYTFISDSDDDLVESMLDLKDTRDWKLKNAREKLKSIGIENLKFFNYLWRPFDFRKIYYSSILIELPRLEVVGQIIKGDNLALCVSRKIDKPVWDDILITSLLADVHSASGQTYIFPLFIYSDSQENNLFGKTGVQQTNFSSEFWKKMKGSFIETLDPWMIFHYIYAILYSNIYREKYNEFLKIDFPKIPFTKDAELFYKIADLGKELVDLHLLKSEKLDVPISKFPITGNNVVRKKEFVLVSPGQFVGWPQEKTKMRKVGGSFGILKINENQYFQGVSQEVWNYYIGGYQVLDKWLKDRLGKTLSSEDVNHYLKIITAIKDTIDLQREIDKLYPEIEKNLIKF